MATRKEIQEFLARTSDKLRAVIMQEMDKNEPIAAAIRELNSLGVVVQTEFNCAVRCIVQDTFSPPQDLSQMSAKQLDDLISDDAFDKWMRGQ